MTQKLVILERDSKEELEKAIKKHLEDANFQVKGFSVFEGLDWGDFIPYQKGIMPRKYVQAWFIIEDYPYMGSD